MLKNDGAAEDLDTIMDGRSLQKTWTPSWMDGLGRRPGRHDGWTVSAEHLDAMMDGRSLQKTWTPS